MPFGCCGGCEPSGRRLRERESSSTVFQTTTPTRRVTTPKLFPLLVPDHFPNLNALGSLLTHLPVTFRYAHTDFSFSFWLCEEIMPFSSCCRHNAPGPPSLHSITFLWERLMTTGSSRFWNSLESTNSTVVARIPEFRVLQRQSNIQFWILNQLRKVDAMCFNYRCIRGKHA